MSAALHGGDTCLGPGSTRPGAGNTGTSRKGWVRLPFLLYANVFFRVMGAISREQERAADALACR